eukprot:544103-Rhodomonas_salina.1
MLVSGGGGGGGCIFAYHYPPEAETVLISGFGGMNPTGVNRSPFESSTQYMPVGGASGSRYGQNGYAPVSGRCLVGGGGGGLNGGSRQSGTSFPIVADQPIYFYGGAGGRSWAHTDVIELQDAQGSYASYKINMAGSGYRSFYGISTSQQCGRGGYTNSYFWGFTTTKTSDVHGCVGIRYMTFTPETCKCVSGKKYVTDTNTCVLCEEGTYCTGDGNVQICPGDSTSSID